jgi:hypothetical protein
MTLHLKRRPGKRSPKQTLAGEGAEAGELVQSIANLPPNSPTHSPEMGGPARQTRAGYSATAANEATYDAVYADDGNSAYTLWLIRDKAASYLSSLGYPFTPQRLAELAVTGDGPENCCWDGHVFYEVTQLIEWAKGRANTPSHTAYHPMV